MKKKAIVIIIAIILAAVICIFSRDAIKSSINQILKEDPAGSAQETSGGLLEDINGNLSGVSDIVIYDDADDIAEDGMMKEYDYVDDNEWAKENWPEAYKILTTADWDMENDIWHNDNIQLFLSIFYDMEQVPGTSYREVPWEAFTENNEKFYGTRMWYNALYLNEIEIVPEDDERAEAVNNGEEFAILHTSLKENDEKEILMYIMKVDETMHLFYREDNIGTRTQVLGWYVGNDEKGNPVICQPLMEGG